MGTAGRKLPKVTNRHLYGLQILNETDYDTRAIRSYVVRCLRALGLSTPARKARGVIRIAYARKNWCAGAAAIGHSARHAGLNMVMMLPRDPRRLDLASFARVLHHEALHWRGVEHEDMTDNQFYCRGPVPSWAPRGVESWLLPISFGIKQPMKTAAGGER